MDKTPTNNLLHDSEGVNQEDLTKAVQNNDVHNLDNIPIGFRFVPTSEQLISAYLLPKINGVDLPYLKRIHEVDVYDYSPYELTANFWAQGENEWYFFTERNRKYAKGKRPHRVTKEGNEACGYWKAVDKEKKVIIDKRQVGSRRRLVYYEGKGREGKKQPWSMHEFVAIDKSIRADGQNMKLDGCVLCRIYKKSERGNGRNNDQAHARAQIQDQHLSMYGCDSTKGKPPLRLIGSSSSTYDPSQEHNNVGLQHPSPSTSHICTSFGSLPQTTQGHEVEDPGNNMLTDMDVESLATWMIDDYDFIIEDFLVDFCNDLPPPPDTNV